MKIKKNTPCYISTLIPDDRWAPILADEGLSYIVKDINNPTMTKWIHEPAPHLMALIINANDVQNLVSGNPDSKTVIWVNKEHIKSSD